MTVAFRGWAVGLVALMVLTSCGAGEESVGTVDRPGEQAVGTEPTLGDPELEATIEETATLALERFGDLETAGLAILVAYDIGYSFDQIVAGVRSGALAADGTIEGVELGVGFASFRRPIVTGDLNPDDIEEVGAALATPEHNDRSDIEQVLRAILFGVPVVRIAEAIVLDELHGMVERAWCEWFFDEQHNDSEGYYGCLEDADEKYGPGVVEPFEADLTSDDDSIPTTTESATDDPAAAPDDGNQAAPGEPGAAVQPSLTVDDVEVELVGCPDPNFPDVCDYRVIVTLDYVTPVVPSTLTCKGGLFASGERSVADQSGTVDVAVVFAVRGGNESELSATCSLASAGAETFVPVSVEAVGDAPDRD